MNVSVHVHVHVHVHVVQVPRYIEWLLHKVSMPEDYGRMMLKASQRLSKLTAKEWITWTVVLSQPVMRQIPKPDSVDQDVRNAQAEGGPRSWTRAHAHALAYGRAHARAHVHAPCVLIQDWHRLFEAWDAFVDGVRLLLSYSITINNVNIAHERFRTYCMKVEETWGEDFMKPNHHHIMHIKQCVLDYGPPHVFWVFAYERSNGQLANFSSSNRTVELEMMKRFVQQQMVLNQDESSLSSMALEHAQLIPSMISIMREQQRSMQVYSGDAPLPLILQSAYNKSWYEPAKGDNYPYPGIGQPDILAQQRDPALPLPQVQFQQQVPAVAAVGELAAPPALSVSSTWLSRWRLYSAQTPKPMSLCVSPPCISCSKLVNDISLLRSEDKEAALAFMPSTSQMWREFRQ
jgi:hypothetical protein